MLLPSALKLGDLYFVTVDFFNNEFLHHIDNTPIYKDDIAIYRLDNVAGTYASRPFLDMTVSDAFLNSARFFARCQNEKVNILGTLCEELSIAHNVISQTVSAGSHDDVIYLLSDAQIKKVIVELDALEHPSAKIITRLADTLDTRSDTYGYLLNVIAYNLLKTFGECGEIDKETEILKTFSSTNVNVCVIESQVWENLKKETKEDPLIPAIENWIEDYSKECPGVFSVHFSLDTKERLAKVKNHILDIAS